MLDLNDTSFSKWVVDHKESQIDPCDHSLPNHEVDLYQGEGWCWELKQSLLAAALLPIMWNCSETSQDCSFVIPSYKAFQGIYSFSLAFAALFPASLQALFRIHYYHDFAHLDCDYLKGTLS